jgi:ABC-type antimicrobial peptide transport system permease subunit
VDERVGDQIAAMPGVRDVDGAIFTAILMPEAGGFFVVEGYEPNGFSIKRFTIVEGEALSGNHQIILGRFMADALNKHPGSTLELGSVRFRVVGIFESRVAWEELGGVMSLRDAQVFAGRPRKVSLFGVQMADPADAAALAERINATYPGVHAALAGEFAEQMPDMQTSREMVDGISILTIVVGGVGVLNAMLMSVFERTREIGVLRAVGWTRWAVMRMILQESAILGLLGGLLGIAVSFAMIGLSELQPLVGTMMKPVWDWDVYVRAIGIALALGLLGGLYPAFRATHLSPIEALRYE